MGKWKQTGRLSFELQDSEMAGMTVMSLSEAGLAARLWSVRKTGARVMVGEDECSTICLESHVLVRYPSYSESPGITTILNPASGVAELTLGEVV